MTRVIHSLWPWQGGCAATAEPDKVPGLTATPSGSTTINGGLGGLKLGG